MKKLIIIFFSLFVLNSFLCSQNYVPNSSFELTTRCMLTNTFSWYTYYDTMLYYWSNTNYGGRFSNDIFHNCFYDTLNGNLQKWSGNPSNYFGYQNPRTGMGYCGSFYGSWPYLHIPNNYNYILHSEFPAVQLNQTLQQGVQYKARFFVSLADSCYFGTDAIGIHITADTLTFDSAAYMNLNLQASQKGTGAVIDTGAWTPISSTFTATGGEQFLIIGSFESDSAMLKTHRSGFPGPIPIFPNIDGTNKYIYYYIDDVAVWRADTIPPSADAGNDTIICKGGKALLGTHNYADYYYEWFPSASLTSDTSGQTIAMPNVTTKYYLRATDFTYEKTLDSVTVYVANCGQHDTTLCIEQAFILNSNFNANWNYKWSPSTFLNYDTLANPQCSPLADIAYQLLITAVSGDTISLDSTYIKVGDCYYSEAGNDSTICKGDSLQIGSHNIAFVSYNWTPNFMISDTAIGNPIVWPDTTTFYYLQVIDTMNNVSHDSVLVEVLNCDTVGIGTSTSFRFAKPIIQRIKVS